MDTVSAYSPLFVIFRDHLLSCHKIMYYIYSPLFVIFSDHLLSCHKNMYYVFLKQYLTTLSLNLVVGFAAFYVVHGVLREKEYELFAFVLATLLVLVYCTVEMSVNVEGRNSFKWVCTQCFAFYFIGLLLLFIKKNWFFEQQVKSST